MCAMVEHLLSIHKAVHSFLSTKTNHQSIISKQKAKNRISQPDEVHAEKPIMSITFDSEDWFSPSGMNHEELPLPALVNILMEISS